MLGKYARKRKYPGVLRIIYPNKAKTKKHMLIKTPEEQITRQSHTQGLYIYIELLTSCLELDLEAVLLYIYF